MNTTTEQKNQNEIREYLENAVAIMFDWMDDHVAYQEMYDTYGDRFDGFIGIQNMAVDAAIAFTIEASNYTNDEDYYWIEAIEEYSFKTFGYLKCGQAPSIEDYHLLAAGCIEQCKIR